MRSGPRLNLRGAVSDVCYVDQRSFRGGASADDVWVIRESLAVRIWGAMSRGIWLRMGKGRSRDDDEGLGAKVRSPPQHVFLALHAARRLGHPSHAPSISPFLCDF